MKYFAMVDEDLKPCFIYTDGQRPIIVPGQLEQRKSIRTRGIYERVDDKVVISCPICGSLITLSSENIKDSGHCECHVCPYCGHHWICYLQDWSEEQKSVEIIPIKIPLNQDPMSSFKHQMIGKQASFITYDEAKKLSSATLYVSGGFGIKVYLACPMNLVKCSEEKLRKLAIELDKKAFNNSKQLSVFYCDEVISNVSIDSQFFFLQTTKILSILADEDVEIRFD